MSSSKLHLSKKFGDLIISGDQLNLRISEDGKVSVLKGDIQMTPAYAQKVLHTLVPENERVEVGAIMPNDHEFAGWVYVGISETTCEPLFVAPKDDKPMAWKEARYPSLKEKGSSKRRLPTFEEILQIYALQNTEHLKGSFCLKNKDRTALCYWTQTAIRSFLRLETDAKALRFSDGLDVVFSKKEVLSTRYVATGDVNSMKYVP